MNKHVVDTLNKYEDGADIIVQQVIRLQSPLKLHLNVQLKLLMKRLDQKNKKFFTAKPDPSKGKIKPYR